LFTMGDVTVLVAAANRGDGVALNQLFSELYGDLRRLAHARLQGKRDLTLLDTTALVHESYFRFLKTGQIGISDRSHFLSYASRVMRSIIVDFFRERSATRRGGDDIRVPLDQSVPADETEAIRVHQALEELSLVSDRLTRVVEMRYFAGMTEPEIAEALGLTERTVRRDWEKARMLLATALK
jgi:RNA polymerase sigma factor (TIGR02999 family)